MIRSPLGIQRWHFPVPKEKSGDWSWSDAKKLYPYICRRFKTTIKIKCCCDKIISESNREKHFKNAFHQKYLLSLSDEENNILIPINKVKCECGSLYIENEHDKHLNTVVHRDYIDKIKKENEKNRRTVKPSIEYTCECGRVYNNINQELHFESEKHLMYKMNKRKSDKKKLIK